ncbi:MAG: hypothetical protein QM528_07130 [Phycisphaerales bacterium]|nr:hypothetical protein [Phycisphaerales bacterium]
MEVKQLTLSDTINLGDKTRKRTKIQKRLNTITQLVNWTEITGNFVKIYTSQIQKRGSMTK